MKPLATESTSPLLWVNVKIDNLVRQADAVEALLEKEAISAVAKLEKQAKGITDEKERAAFDDIAGEQSWELGTLFPQMHRQASLMAAVSLAEIELNKFCDHQAKKRKQDIIVTDLKGQGIVRAREYLSKVGGVQKAWKCIAWQELRRASEIRNAIVHNDAVIESDDIKDYAQRSKHVSLEAGNKITLGKTYLRYVMEQFKLVYASLMRELAGG